MFSHSGKKTFISLAGRAASEEQENGVSKAAVKATQACRRGLFPHGTTLQPPKVCRKMPLYLHYNVHL